MLAKPDVAALVTKLDEEKSAALGLEAEDALAELLGAAKVLQPKIWKGEPVTYVGEDGEVHTAVEFVSGAVAIRAAELLWKKAGLDASRQPVEQEGEVVLKLTLDRDLSDDA